MYNIICYIYIVSKVFIIFSRGQNKCRKKMSIEKTEGHGSLASPLYSPF